MYIFARSAGDELAGRPRKSTEIFYFLFTLFDMASREVLCNRPDISRAGGSVLCRLSVLLFNSCRHLCTFLFAREHNQQWGTGSPHTK